MKNEAVFRDIKEEDISQVLNIYNYYITNDLANFEEPYFIDQNNFNAEVTNCRIIFTDEFGNKKEKTNKKTAS